MAAMLLLNNYLRCTASDIKVGTFTDMMSAQTGDLGTTITKPTRVYDIIRSRPDITPPVFSILAQPTSFTPLVKQHVINCRTQETDEIRSIHFIIVSGHSFC